MIPKSIKNVFVQYVLNVYVYRKLLDYHRQCKVMNISTHTANHPRTSSLIPMTASPPYTYS